MLDKKRVSLKPLPKQEPPKQREQPIILPNDINLDKPKERISKVDEKYVKILSNSEPTDFKAIGDRVQKGELKWKYYTTDGDKGVHYYLINDK